MFINMNVEYNDELFKSSASEQEKKFETDAEVTLQCLNLCENPTVLFIEPFYGGSHKQLIDLLLANVKSYTFVQMKAKKWHWRARCSALILSQLVPKVTTEKVLFCSSVLNLAELLGLRSDISKLRKIVYFHENQLVYPVRIIKERDIQYAYNQITTCLAADLVLFNSNFNKESFLNNIKNIIKMFPDYKPKSLKEQIEEKCRVLYFPVYFPKTITSHYPDVLHIVWPHRWEHDKAPNNFFQTLFKLKENGRIFRISVLGETFEEVPDIFHQVRDVLKKEILHFGHLNEKQQYYNVLSSSHVVVSTAIHEFFGVSVLEAVYCGCFPLVPNRLVYPEMYSEMCLYETEDELYKLLEEYCLNPDKAVHQRKNMKIDINKFSAEDLLPRYLELFSL